MRSILKNADFWCFRMYNYQHMPSGSIKMSDWMNRPSIVQENGNYDQLLLGLVNEPLQKAEKFFTTQVTITFAGWYLSGTGFKLQ